MAAPAIGPIPAGAGGERAGPRRRRPSTSRPVPGLDDERSYASTARVEPRCARTGGTTRSGVFRPGPPRCGSRIPESPLSPGQLLLIDTAAEPAADPPVREIVTLVDGRPADHRPALSAWTWSASRGAPRTRCESTHDLTRTTRARQPRPGDPGPARDRSLRDLAPARGTSRGTAAGHRAHRRERHRCSSSTRLRRAPLAWLAQDESRRAAAAGDPSSTRSATAEGRGRSDGACSTRPWSGRSSRSIRCATAPSTRPWRAADYDGERRRHDPLRRRRLRRDSRRRRDLRGDLSRRRRRARQRRRRHASPGSTPRTRSPPGSSRSRTRLPATGGRDEESADKVREMAPQEFRATQYRAVRPEDYEQAADDACRGCSAPAPASATPGAG